MTLPRPVPFALLLAGVLLHAVGFAGPAWAADIPKDKAAFTLYMQNKLQLYSPLPINVVAPLSLSVGTADKAVALPSLKMLHKGCVASPAKCDHAVNDYVQDAARAFLQKPAAVTPATTPSQMPVAAVSCAFVEGPNATPRDTCTTPRIDPQHTPAPSFRPCGLSHEGYRIEGVVILSFAVRAGGSVNDAAIIVSSGFPTLDAAAVSMITGRRYFPATKNGTPVDTLPKSMKTMFQMICSFATDRPIVVMRETNLSPTQLAARPEPTEKPTCMPADAPDANTRDKCTPPLIDWQNTPQPDYPLDLTGSGESGTVVIDFIVHVDGSVSDMVVTQSSGYSSLDAAAVAQVAVRRYFPATKNGMPVEVHTKTAMAFCVAGTPAACTPHVAPLPDAPGKPK